MSRICDICGKSSIMVTKRKLLRGHWNPVNKTRKYPNLQTFQADNKKYKACTNCLRTLKHKSSKK